MALEVLSFPSHVFLSFRNTHVVKHGGGNSRSASNEQPFAVPFRLMHLLHCVAMILL